MRIGITGGIGSGKSTVTEYLKEKGCKVLDGDELAREVVKPGMPALARIREALGDEVIDSEGALDRERTASIVFADPDKRQTLERITHEAIYDIICAEFERAGKDPVFVDAALIFESGLDRDLDEVWVVTADEDVRIRRVKQRDGITEEEIRARIAAQMSDEERVSRADAVIHNTGNREELFQRTEELLKTHA